MESPRIVVRKQITIFTHTPRKPPKWLPGWFFRKNQKKWYGDSWWWHNHRKDVWIFRECPIPLGEVKTIVQNAKFIDVGLDEMLGVEGWVFKTQDATYMGTTEREAAYPEKDDPEDIRNMSLKEYSEYSLQSYYDEGWLPSYPDRSESDPYRSLSA